MAMSRRRHAEIAGAGLGGLTLASALAQRGWSVRVHERAPQLRDIGVGTSIWENGHKALDAVGALDEVMSYGTRIVRAELIDHRHARGAAAALQRHRQPSSRGSPGRSPSRAGQCRAEGRRRDHHRLAGHGAEPEGVLILESGERLKGDLVVGCDGYNSKVRDSPEARQEVGFVTEAFTGRFTVPREVRPEFEINQNFWSGHRRCGVLSCGHVNYIYLCAPEHCPDNPEEVRTKSFKRAIWTEAFPHLEELFRRANSEVIWNRYNMACCRAWSSAVRPFSATGAFHAAAPGAGRWLRHGQCCGTGRSRERRRRHSCRC